MAAQDLPAFYARTRVALAPLLDFLVRWPAEVTERAFSAVACGAFQITNRTPVTGRFFTEEEIVCADTPQAFADMHRYYVVRPDERTAIVLKGMQRVYREHTYFHRIDRLIDFLDQSGSLF